LERPQETEELLLAGSPFSALLGSGSRTQNFMLLEAGAALSMGRCTHAGAMSLSQLKSFSKNVTMILVPLF
jgi:hypothetical protein